MSEATRTELTHSFLAIYNQLDEHMRHVLDEDQRTGHSELIRRMGDKQRIFRAHRDELQYFAHLRNAIVHNPRGDVWEPIADPHPNAVETYQTLVHKLLDPPTIIEHAVRNVYTTTEDAMTVEVMTEMATEGYSQVPIMSEGMVTGIFTEATPIAYAAINGELLIDRTTPLREFKKFYGFEKRTTNELFEFVARDTPLIDIEAHFADAIQHHARIAAVFITEHGKRNERLLGIVTAWDIAGLMLT